MSSKSIPVTGQLVDQVVEMKRVLGQFTRLIEISLTLNSTQNQNELLNFIITTATDIMECEAVSILLYDEKSEQLLFAASSDSDPEKLAKIPVPLNNSIAGSIYLENRPILINSLDKDPRHFEKVGEQTNFDPQSLVGVPMQIHDKPIGVLEALNKTFGDFQREDIDILSIIASQAAVAINNTDLMVSLQKANTELSKADKIKSDFLAIASHELRTPLIHVLGYAQLLQEDAEGELSEHADKVMNSA
ncbi:MAG: GAF domain-containing protein, partial [Chloroflexota bacterium]